MLAQGGPACLAVAAAVSNSDTRAEKPQRDKKEEEEKKKGGFGFGRYQCRLPYLGPTLLECLRLGR